MYAKLFTSIYQGTLRGNSHGLLVFTNLLAHADQHGIVDIHPRAIAEEIGLTQAQVRVALDVLEEPDEESRSPEHEGRRLIRMDEHRAWGWQIVNFLKYRAIRNEDDRREQNRLAQAKWREKNKPGSAESKPSKPPSAHTEAEAEAEANNEKHAPHAPALPEEDRPTKRSIPDCPHQEILSLWQEVLPTLPQHLPGQWKGTRADHLRARWKETAVEKGWVSKDDGLTYLRRFFGYVGNSPFLAGRIPPRDGKRQFAAELEWVVNPANWAKIHEGKYHQD